MQKTAKQPVVGIYGITPEGNFTRMSGYGSSFNYETDKHLLENNRLEIQSILNPPPSNHADAYQQLLEQRQKIYFACE